MDLFLLLELLCTSCCLEPQLLSALLLATTTCVDLVEWNSTLVKQISQVSKAFEDSHRATLEVFWMYTHEKINSQGETYLPSNHTN